MAKMPPQVLDAFRSAEAVKMLATSDKEGNLNVVVVGTLGAADEETLIFGDLRLDKTKRNLLESKKFTATVFKPPMEGYQLKCTFSGFQESGELMESFKKVVYEAIKMEIKGVGLGKVEEVYSVSPQSAGAKLA
jgi:predicted pyridoxine 5'-phosphate oxidase superfamily flavin-nucleotide-binding protein